MKSFTLAFTIAAAILPAFTSAHYLFPHLIVDGTVTPEFSYVRRTTQGFQPNLGDNVVNSAVMRCNTGSENSGPKTGVYKVKAGQTVGFQTNVKANIEHPGPMQVYLSKAPNGDVRTYDGSGDWFKIWQLGYNTPFTAKGDNWQVWGKHQFTYQIPKDTPPGQYLMRIEHIAIHGGTKPKGPEMYFNCAQIEVESTSTAVPFPVVKIPGVYNARDPALMFNMYTNPLPKSAPLPGPAVWTGGNAPGSPQTPNTPTTTERKPAPIVPAATSAFAQSTFVTKVKPVATSAPETPSSVPAPGSGTADDAEFWAFLRKLFDFFKSLESSKA